MAEESKVDYVDMGSTPTVTVTPGGTSNLPNTIPDIDASLSQEEQDLRLAMALQQAENSQAYAASRKRHEQATATQSHRTIRSNAGTSLSSIRATQKASAERHGGHGAGTASHSASNYYAPSGNGTSDAQVLADARLAGDMQKVEQATAGTARMMAKIQKEEEDSKASATLRNARSGTGAFKPIQK